MRTFVRYHRGRLDTISTMMQALYTINREYEKDMIRIKSYVNIKKCHSALFELGFAYAESDEGLLAIKHNLKRIKDSEAAEKAASFAKTYHVVGFVLMHKGEIVLLNNKPIIYRHDGVITQLLASESRQLKMQGENQFTKAGYSMSALYIEPIYEKHHK